MKVKTIEGKELLKEIVPICKQILEITKKYPDIYQNQIIGISLDAHDDYINITQMRPTGNLKDNGDPEREYLLDYCTYLDEEVK